MHVRFNKSRQSSSSAKARRVERPEQSACLGVCERLSTCLHIEQSTCQRSRQTSPRFIESIAEPNSLHPRVPPGSYHRCGTALGSTSTVHAFHQTLRQVIMFLHSNIITGLSPINHRGSPPSKALVSNHSRSNQLLMSPSSSASTPAPFQASPMRLSVPGMAEATISAPAAFDGNRG